MTPLIAVESVRKDFGPRKVLRDFTMYVNPGEIVGLLGPNGSGKTTTIRLVNGLIHPDAGQITVAGYDPVHDGDAIRAMAGVLTETAGFYPNLSALENLNFYAALYGVTDPRRPEVLLEEFGLGPHRDQKVGTFSTGMKKRLGLARALLHRPAILFLDEPTNGLDPEGIRMVLDYIARLNRRDGTTIILCSHLLHQLERVCSRYVFIQDGRVIEAGTHAELEAKYAQEVVLEVETDLPLAADHYRGVPARRLTSARIAFTLPNRAAIPAFLRALTQEAQVYAAQVTSQDLESLYFKIREVAGRE